MIPYNIPLCLAGQNYYYGSKSQENEKKLPVPWSNPRLTSYLADIKNWFQNLKKKENHKEEKIHLWYCTYLLGKSPYISGPMHPSLWCAEINSMYMCNTHIHTHTQREEGGKGQKEEGGKKKISSKSSILPPNAIHYI